MVPDTHSRRWRWIHVNHFIMFAAVIEEGSFHQASLRLNYVQSALSQGITTLEKALGFNLLIRVPGGPKGVCRKATPTPAGLLVYDWSLVTMTSFEEMVGEMAEQLAFDLGSPSHNDT